MKKIFSALVFLIALFSTSAKAFETKKVLVVWVSDGDTIIVRDLRGVKYRVRLANIDSPEFNNKKPWKNQPFGKKAKVFLERMIKNKRVTVKSNGVDRYGRIIGTVFLRKKNINQEMVSNGLAWVYTRYNKDKELSQLQYEAKTNKKGLWSSKTENIPPWVFRKSNKKRWL